MLNVGDYVGQINKDSSGVWKLYKDKINKITTTKKNGRRYFTKTKKDELLFLDMITNK